MAKLVDVFRFDKLSLRRRQLPLMVDDTLTMVMDLNNIGLIFDNNPVKGKALEEFLRKYRFLSSSELPAAFKVPCKDLLRIINQLVPCVGCRRSVERLFCQLIETGHEALDPLVFTPEGILTIKQEWLESPQQLCSMFHGHSERLSSLVESQTRSKKSHRCNFHSLDSHRTPRAMTGIWREVWDCMQPQCKDEVVLIDAASLLNTLETYLRKHRFCSECRTKVLRAYSLLVEEPDPGREKGYSAVLYAGIKRCLPEKHIHLQTNTDYIGNLITRADLELMGSRRERHAKTLEIAQEEVLTCLGLCVYERLYRIHLRLREEECTCQVLAGVAIEALYRNFEVSVELKQGVSQLELLYEEITKEELAKQQRREHKKLKRRKKKEKKAGQEEKDVCECESEENGDSFNEESPSSCTCSDSKQAMQATDSNKLQVLDRKSKGSPTCCCKECQHKKINPSTIEEDGGGGFEGASDLNSTLNLSCVTVSDLNTTENKDIVLNLNGGVISARENGLSGNGQFVVANGTNSSVSGRRARRGRKGRRCCTRESSVTSSTPLYQISVPQSHQKNGDVSDRQESVGDDLSCNSFSLSPCQSCKDAQGEVTLSRRADSGMSTSSEGPAELNGSSDGASVSGSGQTSPDGSEVACGEGFCSHDGGDCISERHEALSCTTGNLNSVMKTGNVKDGTQLTLQQMLAELCSSDEDGEESYIPVEEIQEFKARTSHLTEKRQELRQTLRKRFDLMCVNSPMPRALTLRPAHCASN